MYNKYEIGVGKGRRNSCRLKVFPKISCRRTLTWKQNKRGCEENVFSKVCLLLQFIQRAFFWPSFGWLRLFFSHNIVKCTPIKNWLSTRLFTIRKQGKIVEFLHSNKNVATWQPLQQYCKWYPATIMHCAFITKRSTFRRTQYDNKPARAQRKYIIFWQKTFSLNKLFIKPFSILSLFFSQLSVNL